MRSRIALAGLAVAGGLIVLGQLHERHALAARGNDGVAGGSVADVAVCSLPASLTHQRSGDVHAFSIATTAWNAGSVVLQWQGNTTNHPVIAQNLYRLQNGRIEMVGMSWVKHGFCALHQFECGACQFSPGCPQFLNPGCSDPYDANVNANQMRLGPRSEINASTSTFPYPYILGWQQTGNSIYKRLQVHDSNINQAENGDAAYIIEAQYVHPQEGTTLQRHNNAGYRSVTLAPNGNNSYILTPVGSTHALPAIYAWQAADPEVVIDVIDVPGPPTDGRFHLAHRVTDNGDGTWRYEYALHNLNSHRSARAFSVPLPNGVNVSDTHYHDVKYHSGEVYSNEPWALDIGGGAISWTGVSFAENPNANALRWSSTFNFGFVADAPPVPGEVIMELFRPGDVSALAIAALVPDDVAQPCVGDLTGSGSVGVPDLLALLACWGDVAPGSDCEVADITDSATVGVPDLLELLGNWGECEE